MKLYGTIEIDVAGEEILVRPGLLARVRKALGGNPDLRTGRVRAALEAAAVVDAVRDALIELGATDAVSLVIDDVVVYQDRARTADDLGDLFLAFHDHAAAIGGGFGLLRLAIEHAEAGLHLVLEVQARTEHAVGDPAVRVVVSGRIQAFEPRAGEDAAAFRARVEPLTRDRSIVELARLSFDSFVARTRDAIARAMPEARAKIAVSEARLVTAAPARAGRPGARAQPPVDPDGPNYDPHEAYYPSAGLGAMSGMLGMAMLGAMLAPSFAALPGITVVDGSNTPVAANPAGAPASEAAAEPAEAAGHDGEPEPDLGGGADDGGDWFDAEL